jgi:hypothetical protein
MRKPAAALGSIGFFALAPGVVAGVLPWYLTDGWERRETCYGWLLVPLGATLVAVGGAALVYAFARYVTEGLGTPAPAAPTELVVVGGLNRCVRNPMYLAVVRPSSDNRFSLPHPCCSRTGALCSPRWLRSRARTKNPCLPAGSVRKCEAYRRSVPDEKTSTAATTARCSGPPPRPATGPGWPWRRG